MQHKFKLKKDGEVVGYLVLKGEVPFPETPSERPLTAIAGLIWFNASQTIMAYKDIELQWDTAHPFVCLDKNKEEVYEGDRVELAMGGPICEIRWQEKYCQWICYWDDPEDGASYVLCLPNKSKLVKE